MASKSSDSSIDVDAVPAEVLAALARLMREMRFGSLEITVHEGRVTQIERREKLRFTSSN